MVPESAGPAAVSGWPVAAGSGLGACWGSGAGWVQLGPDGLAGGCPAGQAARAERGVGERGHQDRAEGVQQPPPPAESGVPVVVTACVDADLDGSRAAHHDPAPRATAVEELLHRRITGQVQHAGRGAVRVHAQPGESQAGPFESLAHGGEVTAGLGYAAADADGRGGADLHLAPGFDGQAPAARQLTGLGEPRQGPGHPLVAGRRGSIAVGADQPFELDPDPSGRAGLEADPVNVLFGGGL